MKTEDILNIDEAKIIGYFETVKSNCYLKCLLELLVFNKNGQFIITFPKGMDDDFNKVFEDYERFKKYLYHGNGAIRDNFHESIINELIMGSWTIFELIIKDLAVKDYSLITKDHSINYHANSLGFSDSEKKDLDLFYYIRNAYCHYNGAYYAYRDIDHIYQGFHFISRGNEGKKMEIKDINMAYQIHLDIEQLIIKGWGNIMKIGKAKKTSA